MVFTFRPIQLWPRPFTKLRRASNFSASYEQTIALLEGELEKIHARNVVIQLALTDADIRRDGLPRARSHPEHPGVIVSFETKHGAVSMPCDAFPVWEDNLRAIALSLEALRKVDRYGVTQSGEQYKGWQALPPTPEPESVIRTREQAAAFISKHSTYARELILRSPSELKTAYRQAARKLHPDNGGSTADFQQLQVAIGLLSSK